jgi:hypothetical protein
VAFPPVFWARVFRPDSFGPVSFPALGLPARALRPCAADSGGSGIGIRDRLPGSARRGAPAGASPGAQIRLGDGDVAGGADDTAPGSMAAAVSRVAPGPGRWCRYRGTGGKAGLVRLLGDRRGDHAGVDQHLRGACGPPRRRTRRYPGAVRRWRRRHQARARWHRYHAQHKAVGVT